MKRPTEWGLLAALIILTGTYAVAEQVTLTTFYPSPRGVYNQLRATQVQASGAAPGVVELQAMDNGPGVFDFPNLALRRSRGTETLPAAVANGDTLGEIDFSGRAPNNTYVNGAKILASVDGVPAGDLVPTRLQFLTRGVGDLFPIERLRIESGGDVGIGTGTPFTRLMVVANGGSENQVNISDGANEWGLILGKNDPAQAAGGYHGPNWAHLINFDNAPLVLGTNNAARMTIDGAGSVGIGTTAPTSRLHVSGAGGSTIDFRVHGRMQTGDADGSGGIWLNSPATMFVGQLGTEVGFYNGAAWRLRLTTDGRLGINQAPTAAVSPSNGAAAGNIDANDVWLRGANRWASQPTAMPFGQFTGGHEVFNSLGQPAKTNITRFDWAKCAFMNDPNNGSGLGAGTRFTAQSTGPAGFICIARRYQSQNRWAVLTTCPAGSKVVSGGGFNYTGGYQDLTPDNIRSTFPQTYMGFRTIPSNRIINPMGTPADDQEGWVACGNNSSGYDAIIVWALCVQ